MKPERWQEIERLYFAALDRDPKDRAAFLDATSGEDAELLHELQSLLNQPGDDSRLERPAWQCKEEQPVSRYTAGTELGAYRIEAPLGAGGMGEVFRALDTRLDRTVAIKVSHRRFTGRFRHEAQAVAALNHPNIVQIFELESDGSDDFIVMEFVPGRTLTQVLRDAPLSIDQAPDYSCQIASALAAAHSAGIVHRDVKTGNVTVTDSGGVKVLDFGLAKMGQAPITGDGAQGTETALGTVFGTAAYMSPEQAQGRSVDARSDIFSTGAVLYEVFTGNRVALEPRFKAGILIGGGMAGDNVIPEVDLLNFAPRVLAPTLMLNGCYDFVYPPASSQLPLFRLLGTPEGQKRHVQSTVGTCHRSRTSSAKSSIGWSGIWGRWRFVSGKVNGYL